MKRRKHRKRHFARRLMLLLVFVLALASSAAVLGILIKALLLVDANNRILLPMLLTMLGTAGALVKFAGWLIEKEHK